MRDTQGIKSKFAKLLEVMDDLREKCPWDREQTFLSLRNLTIEETYELAEAILSNDMQEIREELGDLLLHVVFYARIAEESQNNSFDIGDVIDTLIDKLIRRHPHIYGDTVVSDEADVKKNWENIKMQEGRKSVLEGVPASLPALIKARRIQEKSAQVGFEWTEVRDVISKIDEELDEFKMVYQDNKENHTALSEEFGDLLFSLVNLSRYLDIDPETALERTNRKFKSRFEFIEDRAPRPLSDLSLEEMDQLWEEAKKERNKNPGID